MAPTALLDGYPVGGHYDEMFAAAGVPRSDYQRLYGMLASLDQREWARRHDLAERSFRNHGVTFTVYEDDRGTEKLWPFDLMPRVIAVPEWHRIEAGLRQRVHALNLFLEDLYHDRRILNDRAVPAEVVLTSAGFRRELVGFPFPHGVHCHIAGIDLVRDARGDWHVLEDNLRTPSGVSYMLANRQILKRVWPELFGGYRVRPVEGYAHQLLANLRQLAPAGAQTPRVILLTPGIYNSAYFEHVYLAKQMGIELVEGYDLLVEDDRVHLRTTRGLEPVDVIYRRVDDDFLDPLFGRPDSGLGSAGLMHAYRAGRVVLANAPGNGVADDKAVYALVPQVIRYYLGEGPLLPNVPTYICALPDDRRYVLDHLPELVVKMVGEAGGYGMVIGPAATRAELEHARQRIEAFPRGYIAQPVVDLSVQPAYDGRRLQPRHQDLRPFVLTGAQGVTVTPGGLTRVALRSGSLVVNSSQGGGSRDTWYWRPRRSPRSQPRVLSRVAASLYSTARLLERADHLARLLDVHAAADLDRPGARSRDYWERFLGVCGMAADRASRDAAVELTLGAIATSLADARRLALAVRPSISTEVFQELNVLHWSVQERSRRDLHDFLVRIEFGVHLVSGLVDDSMAHDDAWNFIRLGKHLERAQNVVRLVSRKLAEVDPADPVLWAAVLRCCWAFEAYRWRWSAPVTAERVAAFLLLDRELPRSAAYCIREALDAVRRIDGPVGQTSPHRLLGRLGSLFEYADPVDVAARAAAFAGEFSQLASQLEAELATTYFQPTSVAAPAPVVVSAVRDQQ